MTSNDHDKNIEANALHSRNTRAILLRCLPCAILLLFFPMRAHCQQPNFDLSVNYTFLRAYPNGNGTPFNSNGGFASLSWNIKPRVGIVADFGGYKFGGQPVAVSGELYTYSFGAQFSREHGDRRWTPFAKIMAGGAHVGGTVSGTLAAENGFSMIAGGGVEAALSPGVSLRVGEVNYLLTRFNRVTASDGIQNDLRISAGITFHLGTKHGPSAH